MYYFLFRNRSGPNVSEEQIALLVEHLTKNLILANTVQPKKEQKKSYYEFWNAVTSSLNTKGPLIAHADCWRKVCIILNDALNNSVI